MAGGKETPRQKMIGIMYLVLMTLLALNVSKSILDAFVTQDEQGLEQNKQIVASINAIGIKISNAKLDENSAKSAEEVEPIYLKIKEISNKADDFFLSELNSLFELTEENPEWFTKDPKTQVTSFIPFEDMKKMDNYDAPSNTFGGDPGSASDKRGKALLIELEKYRDELILAVAGEIKVKNQSYSITKANLKDLNTFETYLKQISHPKERDLIGLYDRLTKPAKVSQHKEMKDWNVARFYHQPMIGVVGTFTSLRNDIRLAQQEASKMLLDRLETPMMNINTVKAQVIANTQYINMGEKLNVKVGIIAYDSNATYDLKYRKGETGDYTLVQDSSSFIIEGNSPGAQRVEGKLIVPIAGVLTEKDWSFDYTVGKPSASIASPELNVMYMNYDNKIQAVASGYTEDQVSVTCTGCKSFSKPDKNGISIAKVGGTKTATVYVKADGKTIGSQEFRVFPLPAPQAYFAGKTTGDKTIASGLVKQGVKLTAKLADSPLNVPFEITSFDLEVIVKGKLIIEKGSGSSLSGKMKNMLNNAGSGQKIYFTNVMAAGPGSKPKPIGDLSFKVQ